LRPSHFAKWTAADMHKLCGVGEGSNWFFSGLSAAPNHIDKPESQTDRHTDRRTGIQTESHA